MYCCTYWQFTRNLPHVFTKIKPKSSSQQVLQVKRLQVKRYSSPEQVISEPARQAPFTYRGGMEGW